jgi:hypothetical protein
LVAGVLPREVVILRIEDHTLASARIGEDGRAEFLPVRAADDKRANRTGAEVDADGEHR